MGEWMCGWMNGKNCFYYIYGVLSKEILWTRYELEASRKVSEYQYCSSAFQVGIKAIWYINMYARSLKFANHNGIIE